jgi:DNA-binding LacI/PurR family transcriptional regulator
MISTITQDTNEPMSVSSERTFPAAPFPRKYVHSVFDDLQDARQAVHALCAAGFDARNIHIMTGWDYVEAVERRQTLLSFLSSFDHDVYLREAHRGRQILAVRLSSYERYSPIKWCELLI